MESHYAQLKKKEKEIEAREKKLNNDNFEFMSRAQTSHKKP